MSSSTDGVETPQGQAIVFHQPSPYVGDENFPDWSPPTVQSPLYHGDAELHSPVFPRTEGSTSKRASALDALRGFFLLSMTFGFAIASDHLPVWMYHRQFPAPGDTLVDIAGISWRDVTYGAFLFSMAAAVPIVLARRLARGTTELGIIGSALRRGFMLFVFAILIAHSNPYFLGYTNTARWIAILGFTLTFILFTRAPKTWNQDRFATIQKLDWIAVVLFLALTPLLYGKHFSFTRIDQIIWELAFASAVTWIIWYFTRDTIPARLAILAGVALLFLAAHRDGLVSQYWYSSPFPVLWSNSFLVLLCVTIPGTIAGDQVLRWMNAPEEQTPPEGSWTRGRMTALFLLAAIVTPILVVGMYQRRLAETAGALLLIGASAIALSWRTHTPGERLIRDLFMWGTAWLMLGMATEPLYGGMRKVPDNLSYFLCMAGVSTMMLIAMTMITDLFKSPKSVKLLTDVGQNPMLCYILFTVLLNSVIELVPALRNALLGSPGLSLIRTTLIVIVVALITREFTRRRIFWRA